MCKLITDVLMSSKKEGKSGKDGQGKEVVKGPTEQRFT
jgi:hypothetical protein